MNFGVIGYGYWGPNIVRNLASLEGVSVCAISDPSAAAQARARKAYPGVTVTANAMEMVTSPHIDAVAIVSPVWTHYELTKAALDERETCLCRKAVYKHGALKERN